MVFFSLLDPLMAVNTIGIITKFVNLYNGGMFMFSSQAESIMLDQLLAAHCSFEGMYSLVCLVFHQNFIAYKLCVLELGCTDLNQKKCLRLIG